MRSFQALRGAVLGVTCTALAVSAPIVLLTADRVTSDKDLKKAGSALNEWFTALDEGGDLLEAEAEFRDELTSVNEKLGKKARDDKWDLLAFPADAGQLVYLGGGYDRKAPKRANGKVNEHTKDLGGRGTVEYAVWTPSKYKPKDGPYPILITIPDEGMNPEKHITDHYVDSDFKDATVIAAPKMPGDSKQWSGVAGVQAVMLTLREIQAIYAYDATRMYIGGRGRGGELALQVAHMFPGRFAAAFCWAGDGGEGLTPENLRHVPTYISGGGAKSTAFEKASKDAGNENVTIDAGGGEKEIIAWLANKQRVSFPDRVSVHPTHELAPGLKFPSGAYWIQIPQSDGENPSILAEVNRETNTITLTASGVTEATVFLSDDLVDLSKPVHVIANGEPHVEQFDRSVNVFLEQLKASKNDPGRIIVATKQFHLPTIADGDSSDG